MSDNGDNGKIQILLESIRESFGNLKSYLDESDKRLREAISDHETRLRQLELLIHQIEVDNQTRDNKKQTLIEIAKIIVPIIMTTVAWILAIKFGVKF